jgi:hypothetical protein
MAPTKPAQIDDAPTYKQVANAKIRQADLAKNATCETSGWSTVKKNMFYPVKPPTPDSGDLYTTVQLTTEVRTFRGRGWTLCIDETCAEGATKKKPFMVCNMGRCTADGYGGDDSPVCIDLSDGAAGSSDNVCNKQQGRDDLVTYGVCSNDRWYGGVTDNLGTQQEMLYGTPTVASPDTYYGMGWLG